MRSTSIFLAAILSSVVMPALAQQPPESAAAVVSEPGKAAAVHTVKVSARVVAIDAASRVVTLKGPKGNVVDIVAGDEVRNFAQIKVGDLVVARYVQALTLELKKTKAGVRQSRESEAAVRAQPGERPAAAMGHQVTILADVVGVNRKAKTISLKGPKGNVVTLDVRNPDQFKVVKVGDQVEAIYTEAVGISVEPAPSAAAGKK
jgi:hypothetical protein